MMKIFVSVVIRDGERVLLVQEGKPVSHGKWNLPGGHLEMGEALREGAIREVREETGLEVEPEGVVGIYNLVRRHEEQVASHAVRFIFAAPFPGGEARAGDEILAVRWCTLAEMERIPPEELLSPNVFADLVRWLRDGASHSLDVLTEPQK